MPGLQSVYGITTERSERLRTQMGGLSTQMKALNDSATDGRLSAEDDTRYRALETQFDEIEAIVKREEKDAKRSADLAEPIGTPTRTSTSGDPDTSDGPVNPRATKAYRQSFRRFLMTGDNRGLMGPEQRATADGLQADSDVAGGYTYPDEEFRAQLLKFVDDQVYMRSLATIQSVPNADSLGVPTLEADPEDADWTQELTSIDLDTQMEFGKRELRPHELTKGIKVSRKLLMKSRLGIDGLIAQRLGYKVGITQERAFISGNGVGKPLGVFTAHADGVTTARDVTASATTSFTADNLIDMVYNIKDAYLRNATWFLHRDAAKMARKLKDGDGQYIWRPGLDADKPSTLLNRPMVTSEFAPNTFTTGLYVAVLGDFSFYWIADAEDTSIQRLVELYARTNQVGFFIRSATDGMPVMAEAFTRLKLA